MEIKKGGIKKNFDFFHQTSWNIVGIFTVVCGNFWRVDNIQKGGRCHGIQGAKIVKFIPNFKKLYSNVSCRMQICKQKPRCQNNRMGWRPLLLCDGNSSYYYYSSPFFLCDMNVSTADLRNYWTEFHETWWSYRYMFLVGPKVFSFVV